MADLDPPLEYLWVGASFMASPFVPIYKDLNQLNFIGPMENESHADEIEDFMKMDWPYSKCLDISWLHDLLKNYHGFINLTPNHTISTIS